MNRRFPLLKNYFGLEDRLPSIPYDLALQEMGEHVGLFNECIEFYGVCEEMQHKQFCRYLRFEIYPDLDSTSGFP